MKATENEILAINECYSDLFKYSTPSADFEELVRNANVNELGEKVIPFMDYEIDKVLFEEIVNSCMKKFNINGYRLQLTKNSIYLGCSPKFSD